MENDPEVVRDVPDALQRLIRLVVRGFYGPEHGLVIDVLVRNRCVKEEDIQELLKFDKKQLRTMLAALKNDKFLKTRLCVETQQDGKMLRHNYYYINYRSICNVVKYKLHHIHKRIETQERDLTNRASFKCPTCQSTYTDLEVKFLIDPFTGTLNCTYCKEEVEEDVAADSAQDSRTLQAKFNVQMEPIYKLLKDTENVRLAMEILEPEPTIIPHLHPNAKPNAPRQRPGADRQGGHWTDVKTSGVDYHQEVIINIGDENPEKNEVKAKEVPIWIQQSTVQADPTSAAISSISGESSLQHNRLANSPPQEREAKKDDDEVLAMLMMQERGAKSKTFPSSGRRSDENRSDTSESGGEGKKSQDDDDDDEDDDDFEEVDDNDPVVTVAGQEYSYSEVSNRAQELVQLMTAEEKERYIEISRNMFEDMDH